jgi:hypothetical protein
MLSIKILQILFSGTGDSKYVTPYLLMKGQLREIFSTEFRIYFSYMCIQLYSLYKKTVLPDLIDLTVVTRDTGKALVSSPTAPDIKFFDKVLTKF